MDNYKSVFPFSRCRNPAWILAFSWVCGLSFGLFLASRMHGNFSSLMRTALTNRVSIVGLLIILLFPFISSAVAVWFSRTGYLYLLVAGKGICFSFCVYLIMVEFPSSGWLFCRLLLFSELCILPPLFYLWIKSIEGGKQTIRHSAGFCLLIAVVAGVLDYFLISPFTVTLMLNS